MTTTDNPWKNMGNLTRRRADPNTPHDIYWIKETTGKYGLWINAASVVNFKEEAIKLKGITITKNIKKDGGDLFLILESSEDWEVFRSLCKDLISVTVKYKDEEKMMSVIDGRLHKWQQMLKSASLKKLSIEEQMGLYGELLCLKELVIPELGVLDALKAWTGPQKDKQDFLLENAVIEVKCSKTTKGEMATISSLGQLSSNKNKFFITFYNISPSEKGTTIEELSKEIKEKHFNEHPSLVEFFESKLLEYGYISELNPLLEKFQVDNKKAYVVNEKFPRLTSSQVDTRIVSVKYTIDLSRLSEFEVEYDNVIKEESL
ncbi:PD-(D/E)XK motif protein [Planococcus beijingensis]|uniref:PD-(D/E)XK motif protein n=1 Tax=Planococcus beijingensis TaxID=2782551 RepID=UPI00193C2385|nr:PD-(D/E)XK motif protein [Planococcus beijingensis]